MHLAFAPWLLIALAGGTTNQIDLYRASVESNALPLNGYYSISAQAAETATVTLSATATLSQSTPVPLPTAEAISNLGLNPLDWNFLTSPPNPAFGPFAWVYALFMLGLFGVSAYFYFVKRKEWKKTNTVLRKAAERWGSVGLWISGLGLLFVIFRAIGLDFFNFRFWFYFWFLAALVAIGWFFYWYRTTLPKEMERYMKTQRNKQYLPGAAKKTPAKQVAPTSSSPTSSTPPTSASNSKRRRKK